MNCINRSQKLRLQIFHSQVQFLRTEVSWKKNRIGFRTNVLVEVDSEKDYDFVTAI